MEIEERGEEIAAIYHSHTKSPRSSQTDINLADNWPDPLYLICSLAEPERPTVRGFAIRDGRSRRPASMSTEADERRGPPARLPALRPQVPAR